MLKQSYRRVFHEMNGFILSDEISEQEQQQPKSDGLGNNLLCHLFLDWTQTSAGFHLLNRLFPHLWEISLLLLNLKEDNLPKIWGFFLHFVFTFEWRVRPFLNEALNSASTVMSKNWPSLIIFWGFREVESSVLGCKAFCLQEDLLWDAKPT